MQAPQRSFLRPLSAGELIGQTFEAFRRLFGQLALIPLLLLVPIYVAASVAAFDPWLPILRRVHEVTRDGKATLLYAGAKPSLVAWIVLAAVVVAYAVMQVVMSAAVVTVVGQGYVGAPARWQLGVRLALRRCGSVLWTSLLLVVVMLVGVVVVFFLSALLAAAHVAGLAVLPVLAGLIGAVWLAVSECVLIAVIVCEQVSGMAALRRSLALVKGRWGATLGVLLVVVVVTQIAAGVLQTLGEAVLPRSATFVIIGLLIAGIASLLFVPLVPVATACLYFDLKNRHEGLDLVDVAHRLGVSGGSSEARGPAHAAPWGDARGSRGGGAGWSPPPPPPPPPPLPPPETVAEATPPRPAVWPAISPKPPAPRASWTTDDSSSGAASGSGDTTPGDAAQGEAEAD